MNIIDYLGIHKVFLRYSIKYCLMGKDKEFHRFMVFERLFDGFLR